MYGFSTRYFLDPLEALDAARIEVPDLLISDVVMPQFSGVDLAVRIQKECPACKVLLFSGQAATTDLLRPHANKVTIFDYWQSQFTQATCYRKLSRRMTLQTMVQNLSAVEAGVA